MSYFGAKQLDRWTTNRVEYWIEQEDNNLFQFRARYNYFPGDGKWLTHIIGLVKQPTREEVEEIFALHINKPK